MRHSWAWGLATEDTECRLWRRGSTWGWDRGGRYCSFGSCRGCESAAGPDSTKPLAADSPAETEHQKPGFLARLQSTIKEHDSKGPDAMVVGLKGGSDAAMMSALAKEASSASSNKVDTPATKSATSHKRKPRFHLRPQGFMADHSNTAWWCGTFFYFHKNWECHQCHHPNISQLIRIFFGGWNGWNMLKRCFNHQAATSNHPEMGLEMYVLVMS